MTLAEGGVLAELVRMNQYESLGFVRQGDFAVEALKIHPRTLRRRVALHRLFESVPELVNPFLDGRLGASQALAIRNVVTRENALIWVRIGERLPVRELQSLARRAREKRELSGSSEAPAVSATENVVPGGLVSLEEDPLTDPRRKRVTFLSPQSAAFAVEHGLESARRVLGWEAPRDECLEAVLSEAESTLALSPKPTPEGEGGDRAEARNEMETVVRKGEVGTPAGESDGETTGESPRRGVPVWCHKQALKGSRRLLRSVDRLLGRIDRLTPTTPEDLRHVPPGALVDRHLTIQRQKNPVRILIARILHHIETLGVAELLGHGGPVDLGATLLDITPRSARDLLEAGHALDSCPPLADAYARGRIGFGQVVALGRVVGITTMEWIRRAHDVTARQFQREVRLLGRLGYAVPNRIGLDDRAFPRPDLESMLRKRLFELGWIQEDLDREFRERGLQSPPGASTDPAENPALMSRLEMLVDLLAIERCGREDSGQISVVDRPGMGKLLSVPGRHRRVTIWARDAIAEHWRRLQEGVLGQCGNLPAWAVATLLVKAAEDEWNRVDPDRIPTERKILERDGYRCQAPGCSSRRLLEVHHIIFQSQGGPDAPWNLITLCVMHHQHAVHRRTMRVTGKAPYDLTWEMGLSAGFAGARWTFHGERLSEAA